MDTSHLYTDLAWLWPMWGDATSEYAHYCRHVAGLIEQYETTILYLIRDHGRLRIETDHWTMGIFSLDTWRHVLRETGFEVHEGRYHQGEESYMVFGCVKYRGRS